jgi:hypothetical protein
MRVVSDLVAAPALKTIALIPPPSQFSMIVPICIPVGKVLMSLMSRRLASHGHGSADPSKMHAPPAMSEHW